MKPQDDVVVIDEDLQESVPVINEDNDDVPVSEDNFDGRVTQERDGKISVLLKYPFTCRFRKNGQETEKRIDTLTFRPVNGSDMRAIASFRNPDDKSIKLFCRLAGIVDVQFDRMDSRDINFCMEAIESFLLNGQETGKAS